MPPIPGLFQVIAVTVVPGATNGIGTKTIVFAKGALQPIGGGEFVQPATLTISVEATTLTPPSTVETVITTVQLCILNVLDGGCSVFQGSSLLPFDTTSGAVPRIAAVSSSGTGIAFYGQEVFLDIPEYTIQGSDGIVCTVSFTAPVKDVVNRIVKNLELSETVPGFVPPEASGVEAPNNKAPVTSGFGDSGVGIWYTSIEKQFHNLM